MIRAILLDIDNTIAHKEKSIGKFITLPPANSYISVQTHKLLGELSAHVPIVLITGRRSRRYPETKNLIPHRYAIFENGAVIFDSVHGKLSWEGNDATKLKHLGGFEKQLRGKGYRPYREGRAASFRIDKKELSTDGVQELKELLVDGIKLVSNGPFCDFVVSEAGKENAAGYVLSKLGKSYNEAAFVGDDINDLALLKLVGHPMTICKSNESVVSVVKKRGGYVTKREGHAGIIEALQHIKRKVISSMPR